MYKLFIIAILLSSCAASYPQGYPGGNQVASIDNSVVEDADEEAAPIDNAAFNKWLEDFKKRAISSGISKETVKTSLKLVEPVEKVVSYDKKQPEVKRTKEEYLANVINNARIEKGRQMMQDNAELLSNISRTYGVEPEFIVALWGLETSYGKNTGNFNILNSLATLAYEGRRRDFFESELISALLIIDQGHIKASDMRGSWAGAMGQCQFMPSSFLAYAVDYDRDGKTDIWTDKDDVLASIANYLNTVGWGADEETKRKALMHWNRSTYFVASVFKLAEEIRNEG